MTEAVPSSSQLPVQQKRARWVTPLIYDILLVFVLLIGAAFRFIGIQWGEFQYLHPDERFLIWVGTDIAPIDTPDAELGTPPNTVNNSWRAQYPDAYPDCKNWGGYFDASCSPLNPNNRGHSFYVYGTLPMFITRYIVEWVYGHSGFNEMTIVGRILSAIIDLSSVVLVYLIGKRLFSRSVGLLAAAFAAFTVLNIQQSHFFTMDTFFSFFTLLAVYFAVCISLLNGKVVVQQPEPGEDSPEGPAEGQRGNAPLSTSARIADFIKQPYFGPSIAFGIALGCAVASKLSAAPVAFVLPVAYAVVIFRKPAAERSRWLINAFVYLGIAAVVSILVFRLFQPYAFLGPGFLGVRPNPQWVSNIREQRAQAAGDIDFPPSLQWARRPIWFSAQNMAEWGLGIPLAILAAFGFLWAGWRMLKGDWQRHVVLWSWGGFYFVWQSMQFNPTMRYQMPTYPILTIYAAWGLVELWNLRRRKRGGATSPEDEHQPAAVKWAKPVAILGGALVLVATLLWALGFSLIYARPITRVAASDWIYQNIPGPINLHIQTGSGEYNQPLSIPYGITIQADLPYQTVFTAHESGTVNEVALGHVANELAQPVALDVFVFSTTGEVPLSQSSEMVTPSRSGISFSSKEILALATPLPVKAGAEYTLMLTTPDSSRVLNACGPLELTILTAGVKTVQSIPTPTQCLIQPGSEFTVSLPIQVDGSLESISLSQLVDQTPAQGQQTIQISIASGEESQPPVTASLTADFGAGTGYTMTLDTPLVLEAGRNYNLSLALVSGEGRLTVQGSAIANEGDWDDGLPLRVDGYDPFGGIYTPGLNFNMYTDDNADKLEHFIDVYDRTEYILISSNRQWGSLPRLPERFPMSSLHYRYLLGCPDDKDIGWCYSVAEPGLFQGKLGFELVAIFQSDPTIGPFSVNDQFAEEAFTVYDHPKVLVFKKTSSYNSDQMRQILSQANFGEIVRITPKKAAYHPANLILPEVRLYLQTIGGTWSQLFDPQAPQNRYQILAVIVWYLSVAVLGLLTYPLLRITLPGLRDRGYPLARTAGMLILAYLTWLAGSVNISFSRLTITLVILIMAAVGIYLAYRQRVELREEWRSRRKYFLIIEGLFLVFFVAFLLVRLGNPDLWHPWKGGEKPMDFSYFNAILKSSSFPPYDPWYAGGYMNYYYWGFVFVGVLVKWLGIVPSIAYNLILPTLFSLVAMGAFCIGYNLSHPRSQGVEQPDDPAATDGDQPPEASTSRPYWIGVASAVGMTIVGNLGT
ncbi:MAG: phospholipid carrier-dependent glycosyltransferase, partial [Anaerolineae bacterium]|nr:phospholipid carrier-dependent glycosyltransferase [Anaerolineae bacterium]